MPSVRLFLSRLESPRDSSVAAGNAMLAGALERLGCRIERHGRVILEGAEQFLPLPRARFQSRLLAEGPSDLAFYDDAGLELCLPNRGVARKSAVLYHGLAWNQPLWLANPDVDLHCGNSAYLASVLRCVLSYPDWHRRRCLDPRAFGNVADLTLALPCVDEPEGLLIPYGADAPATVMDALADGSTWGHALQAGKHDWTATVNILVKANELARERGDPPIRLLVAALDLARSGPGSLAAAAAASGARLDELVRPVPLLNQRALFRIMASCRFALAYNAIPESFGFHILESVYHGCPVYTNGAGNIRHALPRHHGITVLETCAMEPADASSYAPVAQRLLDDLARPAEMAAKCARGAALMREKLSLAAFERRVGDLLSRIGCEPDPVSAFEDLEISVSPLVRCHETGTGVLISDLARMVLSREQVAVLASLPGRTCGDAVRDRKLAPELLDWFFDQGILTLAPPGAATRHPPTASPLSA